MRELALFSGAGGGILGGLLLGWRTVCAVEIDPYCRNVLLARQRDGFLPRFPVWDNVQTFDGRPWRGHVDVISGGFPCQDISSAGTRTGLDGERSGLWREFARIIAEVQPSCVFIENSPHLRTRGLVRVLKDLARMGFDAKWGCIGADAVGAPHLRKRMWIVAHLCSAGLEIRKEQDHMEQLSATQRDMAGGPSNANDGWKRDEPEHEQVACAPTNGRADETNFTNAYWWPVDIISRVDDGMAHRVDRIAATGEGQVPAVARLAWETLR